MRPIWKGSISFGLVNIPVGLYSATKPSNEVKFKLLRNSDLSPIRYKRVAEADEKEVEWKDIVKGYEYEKGHYLALTDKDFESVEIKSQHVIEIVQFVDAAEVDPMFFDQPYYLVPEKGGGKAYGLLRQALLQSHKLGLAKVVLRTREHLAAVKPLGRALVLELMHFAEELMSPEDFQLPAEEVGKKELEMAEMLIETMTEPWQPQAFQDEYRAALMAMIDRKLKAGSKEGTGQKGRAPLPTNVVDIVEVLQKSLAESGKKKRQSAAAKMSEPPKRKRASAS
jgi:DNA end-binding protein Ku